MNRLRMWLIAISAAAAMASAEEAPTSDLTTPTFEPAGLEVLGSGYDVTGRYADVADVKAAILDLSRLRDDQLLRQIAYERGTFRTVSGKDSKSYQKNLAIEAGLEVEAGSPVSGEFSGALKASFKRDRYGNREYSFATVQSIIRKRALQVAQGVTLEDLRRYVTPAAATALQKLDPHDLFETFGTHVLTGIIVGGRLDFNTSANMSFERESRDIDVYARASFDKKFVSVEGEASFAAGLSESEYSATEEQHLEVYGGLSEKGQYIINDTDYREWIDTVDENVVFADFAPKGLIGIWELLDDEERRQALKAAWGRYAATKAITWELGQVGSDFEQDTEGWKVIAATDKTEDQEVPPEHAGGRGDGYCGKFIYGEDLAGSGLIRFRAPPKFRGDKSPYSGGTLAFVLWYRGLDANAMANPYFATPLVELQSRNGNLVYRAVCENGCPESYYPPKPRDNDSECVSLTTSGSIKEGMEYEYLSGACRGRPRRYEIRLSKEQDCASCLPEGRWYLVTGDEAEEAEQEHIDLALSSVEEIYINGEFLGGFEHTALDRVILRESSPDQYPIATACGRFKSPL